MVGLAADLEGLERVLHVRIAIGEAGGVGENLRLRSSSHRRDESHGKVKRQHAMGATGCCAESTGMALPGWLSPWKREPPRQRASCPG